MKKSASTQGQLPQKQVSKSTRQRIPFEELNSSDKINKGESSVNATLHTTKVTPAAKALLNLPMEDMSSSFATNLASQKQAETPSPAIQPLLVTESTILRSHSRPTAIVKPLEQHPTPSLFSIVVDSALQKPVRDSMTVTTGVSAFSPNFNAKVPIFEVDIKSAFLHSQVQPGVIQGSNFQAGVSSTKFLSHTYEKRKKNIFKNDLNFVKASTITSNQHELPVIHRSSTLKQDSENQISINVKRRKLFQEQDEATSENETNERIQYSSVKKWCNKFQFAEPMRRLNFRENPPVIESNNGFKVPRQMSRLDLSGIIDTLFSYNDASAMEEPKFHGSTTKQASQKDDGKYNRKEISLDQLCKRFLHLYGRQTKSLLLMDQCVNELRTERRHIYDIINILESFSVIRRQAKNSYQWRGIDRIVLSIEAQIKQSERYKLDQMQTIQLNKSRSEVQPVAEEPIWMPNFIEIQSDEEEQAIFKEIAKKSGSRIKKYKKEKCLSILCQQFIHLFITWQDIISLEGAAQRISMGEKNDVKRRKTSVNQREQKLNTKIRRLYDIANVLTSLGLIKKCRTQDSKKPAFQWVGIEGTKRVIQEIKDLNALLNEKYKRELAAAGRDLIQVQHEESDSSEEESQEKWPSEVSQTQTELATPVLQSMQKRRTQKMHSKDLFAFVDVNPRELFKQVHSEYRRNIQSMRHRMARQPSNLAFMEHTARELYMNHLLQLVQQVRLFEAQKTMLAESLRQF